MSDNYPKSADGVIVRLDRNVNKRAVAALLSRAGQAPGTFRVDWSNGSGMYYLKPKHRLALPRAWQLARNLRETDTVLYAEVDAAVPGLDAPGADRKGPKQFFRGDEVPLPGSDDPEWSLECARVKQAWALKPKSRRYGQGIRIGHPDTGYRRHPEIDEPSRLLSQMGFDFEDGKSDPVDPLKKPHFGHGTSTASVIMSAIGSPDGSPEYVSGVAPKVELVPFRVSKSVVHFRFGNVVKAIYRSIEQNCHVISMSLGGPFGSQALFEAVADAQKAGIVLLAAAGNQYKKVVYPARIDSVVAVAANNVEDKPWKHSARGVEVDVSAPGESVWRARAQQNGRYDVKRSSGTSYAVATTAGICCLWLSHHGRQNLLKKYDKSQLSAVFQGLLRSAGYREIDGWDTDKFGVGIVDAHRMLRAALPAVSRVRRVAPPFLALQNYNTVEEIAAYFPDVPPARLTGVLQKTLAAGHQDLFRLLEVYGDELRYHCSSNAEFRRSLASLASPRNKSIRGFRGARVRKNAQLTSQASQALLERMNGTE